MKSYLTLEQFGSLVKNNTNNLITLGGSVNSAIDHLKDKKNDSYSDIVSNGGMDPR
jgi:hypothetical protein